MTPSRSPQEQIGGGTTVTNEEIDAGAQALRDRQQGGKKLNPWDVLSNGSKRKWRDHAACVLTAAASARQIKAASDRS